MYTCKRMHARRQGEPQGSTRMYQYYFMPFVAHTLPQLQPEDLSVPVCGVPRGDCSAMVHVRFTACLAWKPAAAAAAQKRLHNGLKIMSKQVLRGSTDLCNYPLELPAGPGLHSCTQCRPLPLRASRCCCCGCCCCSPGDADGGPGRSGVARSPRGRRVGERCRSERRTPEGDPVSWPAPQGAERNLL